MNGTITSHLTDTRGARGVRGIVAGSLCLEVRSGLLDLAEKPEPQAEELPSDYEFVETVLASLLPGEPALQSDFGIGPETATRWTGWFCSKALPEAAETDPTALIEIRVAVVSDNPLRLWIAIFTAPLS
ncbi:MAG: hypothetical protein RMI94_11665 [Bryobacterales bacterium]|nr:hypothetical protein [Bryobacterales bacterium]